MLLRQATLADLDQATDAFITAMPTDPSWAYRFPYRHEHPADHRKYNRDLIRRFLSPDYSDWLVMVVEVSDEEPPETTRIASFAVWAMRTNAFTDPPTNLRTVRLCLSFPNQLRRAFLG